MQGQSGFSTVHEHIRLGHACRHSSPRPLSRDGFRRFFRLLKISSCSKSTSSWRGQKRAAALLNPGSTAFSHTAPLGAATLSGRRSASFQPNYFIHEASLHLANEVFSVIGIWWPDPLVTSLYKVFISHSLNATGPNYFSFKKQSFPVKFHSSFCFPSLAAI